jgi:hypothetical protein
MNSQSHEKVFLVTGILRPGYNFLKIVSKRVTSPFASNPISLLMMFKMLCWGEEGLACNSIIPLFQSITSCTVSFAGTRAIPVVAGWRG